MMGDAGLAAFDYEDKTWGAHEVRLAPMHLGALRLRYCLADLGSVTGRYLEVGCGAGAMARAIKLYRPDLQVSGCDISENAIQAALSRPSGVKFGHGDAEDLPHTNAFFDAVGMFDVLEHLREPMKALAEIRRVLKPGGLFHLFVPCEGSSWTLHGRLPSRWWLSREKLTGHIQRFAPNVVLMMLKENGFSTTRQRWSGHLLYQVADMAYFIGLAVLGLSPKTSVEGYLGQGSSDPARRTLNALKGAVALGIYAESRLLSKIPGWGFHVTSRKMTGDML